MWWRILLVDHSVESTRTVWRMEKWSLRQNGQRMLFGLCERPGSSVKPVWKSVCTMSPECSQGVGMCFILYNPLKVHSLNFRLIKVWTRPLCVSARHKKVQICVQILRIQHTFNLASGAEIRLQQCVTTPSRHTRTHNEEGVFLSTWALNWCYRGTTLLQLVRLQHCWSRLWPEWRLTLSFRIWLTNTTLERV